MGEVVNPLDMVSPQCAVHDTKIRSIEARITPLEVGQKEVAKAISDVHDAIRSEFAELRVQLFGNGKLNQDGTQAGLFPLMDRRIGAVERRTEFDAAVKNKADKEVEERMAALESTEEARDIRKIDRQVEKLRDELQAVSGSMTRFEKLKAEYNMTPRYARVIIGIGGIILAFMAPDKIESVVKIVVEVLKAIGS